MRMFWGVILTKTCKFADIENPDRLGKQAEQGAGKGPDPAIRNSKQGM